jgi:hypothetical protein
MEQNVIVRLRPHRRRCVHAMSSTDVAASGVATCGDTRRSPWAFVFNFSFLRVNLLGAARNWDALFDRFLESRAEFARQRGSGFGTSSPA